MTSRDLHCTETKLKIFVEVPTSAEFLDHINGRRDHDLELSATGEDPDPDCPTCGWGPIGCAHDDSGCRKTGRTTDDSVWMAVAVDMDAESYTIADAEFDEVLGVWTRPASSVDEWLAAQAEDHKWGKPTDADKGHIARREALEMLYKNFHGHPALAKQQKYADSVYKRTSPNATARYGMDQFDRGVEHKEAWKKAYKRADMFITRALQRYCDELEVASFAGVLPSEYRIYLRFGQEALMGEEDK